VHAPESRVSLKDCIAFAPALQRAAATIASSMVPRPARGKPPSPRLKAPSR
jgi:hypothetical protein